jgi:hypothetical protein
MANRSPFYSECTDDPTVLAFLKKLRLEDRSELRSNYDSSERLRAMAEQLMQYANNLKDAAKNCPPNHIVRTTGSCTGFVGDENMRYQYIPIQSENVE